MKGVQILPMVQADGKMVKMLVTYYWSFRGSTVVEHNNHNHGKGGLNHTYVTGRVQMVRKVG
jgi:hypothetical protein